MSKQEGNGQEEASPTAGKLARILGRAKSEQTKQEGFWRTHAARERARQARVRARDEKKGGKK
jgi:hypothetical protein